MKYIRTKDGRFIDLSDCELDDENEEYYYYIQHDAKYGYKIRKNNILKQADTIEELCDEFVAMKPNNLWRILSVEDYLNGFKDEMTESYEEGYQVYGAVWCEWGSRYVARMNSEGVLELL